MPDEVTRRRIVTSSGMAAISTRALRPAPGRRRGDLLLGDFYGGTLHVIADFLRRFGVDARFVSLEDLAAIDQIVGPRTRVVWFESPINPTLRCVDIAAVAAGCRTTHVVSILG